ncbi:MAG: hypothetical protein J3Q66DRAFT_394048 [Benniella sp.]|nr:MAG: hypothetical protein J3Q66DRAFT_394048 [Benniella sp.]
MSSTSEPVSPYHGLKESLFQPSPGLPHKEPAGPHRRSQAHSATPELHLGELFLEEKQPNQVSNLPASAKAYPDNLGPSSATSATTVHEASDSQPMIGAYRKAPVNVSVGHSPSISSLAVATPDIGAAPLHEAPASTLKSHKRQVLGEAYDEPIQASSSLPQHQQSKQFESNDGLNAASVRHDNVPKQPRKLSKRERKAIKKREAEKGMGMLDTISTVFVGASTVAAITSDIGGNIRSLVGSMNLHSKADDDMNDSNRSSSTSDRTDTVEELRSHKHEPSTAAIIETPVSKINLGLFPEEEAECPPTTATTGHPPRAALGPMVLNLHLQHAKESSVGELSQSAHTSTATHLNRPGETHFGAVALKTPKLDLLLFPEEQADYPRDDDLHLTDDRMSHLFVRTHAIEKNQLDDAHRHTHHDLHPPITESAAADVSQDIEGSSLYWNMSTYLL